MRDMIKRILPEQIADLLRAQRLALREFAYRNQRGTRLRCGDFELEAPSGHLLKRLHAIQPFRDLCLGVAARCICEKYGVATVVDIGANIGDTAAVVATFAPARLILVEGSSVFFEYLVRNVRQLPNEVVTLNVLVGDGSTTVGGFEHWGGTASFKAHPSGRAIRTVKLEEVVDGRTRLIKLDTDGYDFRILRAGLPWLSKVRPAIFVEDQIRTGADLDEANDLFARLGEIGYSHFIAWDDPGRHILSTSSVEVIADLNRYLFVTWQSNYPKSIANYDVLCLHDDDRDVFEAVSNIYRSSVEPPVAHG